MTTETQVFRPTKKTRLVFISMNITAFILFGSGLWYISSRIQSLFFGFLLLCYLIMFAIGIGELLNILRRRLQLDKISISGHTGKKTFHFNWNEIITVNLITPDSRGKNQELIICTQVDEGQLDLFGFDKTAVWQAVESFAPPEILEADAYQKLDSFKFYEQEIDKKLNSMSLPVSVTLPIGMRIVFIVGFLFFSFCAYMSYASEPTASYIFMFFVLFNLYGILAASGSFIADTEKLTVKKLWGIYQISWSDIEFIEISSYSGWIVFHGNGKRLGFAAPGVWGGKQKKDLHLFMEKQIEERQLEVKQNWKAPYHISKNTKVKS